MGRLEGDVFLWALAAACRIHRIPFDPRLARQQFPPPHTLETLREALAALGLRNAEAAVGVEGIAGLTFPCFVALCGEPLDSRLRGNDCHLGHPPCHSRASGNPEAPPAVSDTLALALRCADDRILLLEPGDSEPREIKLTDFAARYAPKEVPLGDAPKEVPLGDAPKEAPWGGAGLVLQFAPRAEPVADPDAGGGPEKFGFRWFIPELLKHKRIWRDVLLASLAIQLVGLATPLFTQVVIDKVVVHQTLSTLTVIGIGLVVFMIFTAAMSWVRQYLVLHTGNRVDAVLGSRVFDHLLDLSPRYFEHRPTGVVVARLHGVETIREFVSGAAVSLLLDLPFLFIFLAVMFWYSWQLSLIAVGLLFAIALLSFLVAPALRARLNTQFLTGARNQAFLTEYLAGIETVKSLQMEPQLKRRYGGFLAEYLAASFGTRQLSNTYSVAANGLEQIMTLSILCVGAWLVMQNDGFTIGMLVAFQMFAGRLSQPLLRLVGLWQEFQQAGIAVKRLGDILDAPHEPLALTAQRAGNAAGNIDIQNLGFRYGPQLPWLYRGLSLALRPGRCIALMGPSGAGKSTLAKLLQGFYFAEEGRILIDGRDVRSLAANELRAHFGVVPQETMLFSGTIYDNLILASPHASFEQVVQACQWAEIHDTIEQLPDGYQTVVGERGIGLSGGQKQRIAIARALIRQPHILVFDEATANLDAATAEHFAHTVNKLKGRVTMLFITHQLPRGLQVDELITLGEHGTKMAMAGEGSRE